MLGTILLWAIVLLMLVVLIPIALAWYQRIRSRDIERAKPPAAAPTKKVPPPPMTAAQAAAPSAPAAPKPTGQAPVAPPKPAPRASEPSRGATTMAPPESTQMSRAEDRAPAEPAGTEMVQWYGMLHCTSGPLEGQRFIIEEEGLYIGRDPQLAKIVIPDTRVSKRHVRIIPRDGRVWAIDQNSTNGTFMGKVGGQRIAEVQLKRGDTLILADGAATFVYQI